MVVCKIFEIIYGIFLFIQVLIEMEWSLTLRKHIREVPELKT